MNNTNVQGRCVIKHYSHAVTSKISFFDINYLLTESEVFMGKSQTETLLYWLNNSEVNKLFIIWLFALVLRARNQPMGITGE